MRFVCSNTGEEPLVEELKNLFKFFIYSEWRSPNHFHQTTLSFLCPLTMLKGAMRACHGSWKGITFGIVGAVLGEDDHEGGIGYLV